MNSIKICNVPFDLVDDAPVGISLSGGADSSLLLYILMSFIKNPIHIFTCSNGVTNRMGPITSLFVINECIKLTQNQNIFHHTHFVEKQDHETLFSPLRSYVQSGLVSMIYVGTSAAPPPEIETKFKGRNTFLHKRNPAIQRDCWSSSGKFYNPFHNIDKQKIKEIYDHFNITNTLFPITRSCESREITSGHCGECWWCEERNWGFGKL